MDPTFRGVDGRWRLLPVFQRQKKNKFTAKSKFNQCSSDSQTETTRQMLRPNKTSQRIPLSARTSVFITFLDVFSNEGSFKLRPL
jgi:hypothetical protein